MSEAAAFPENSPCDRGRMPAAPSYAGLFYDRHGRPHYRPDEEEMTSATFYQSRADDDDSDGGIIDDHAIVFYPPLAGCIPAEFQPPTAPGRSNHPGVYRPVDARTNRE